MKHSDAKQKSWELTEETIPTAKLMSTLPTSVTHFLTVEEVAAMLRCKPRTIYNRVHQKRMPYHKAGKFLLFDPKEIEEWARKSAR